MTRFALLLAGCLVVASPVVVFAEGKGGAKAAQQVSVARVYDVRDITMPIRDFPAPEMGLGGGGAVNQPANNAEDKATSINDLIDTIQTTIKPDLWGTPGFAISKFKGTLVVRATGDVHREVRKLLAKF